MQQCSRLRTVLIGSETPESIARRAFRNPPCASRDAVANGLQDFDTGHRPSVRTVQHHNLRSDDATLAQSRNAVTRTDQQNVLRT